MLKTYLGNKQKQHLTYWSNPSPLKPVIVHPQDFSELMVLGFQATYITSFLGMIRISLSFKDKGQWTRIRTRIRDTIRAGMF